VPEYGKLQMSDMTQRSDPVNGSLAKAARQSYDAVLRVKDSSLCHA